MRLLYVITDLETGGVPLHLLRLAQAMRTRGHEIQVVCLSPPGPVSAMLNDAGFVTHACNARGAWDLPALLRLRRIVRNIRPDLVHSFLFHANIACRVLATGSTIDRSKLLCEIQTVEIERTWHLKVERRTWRFCRGVIGNSQSVIDHLATAGGVPREKLFLVQGGVDPDRIRQTAPASRSSLGLPDNTPVLIWTGRLDPVKGLDDLMHALQTVRKQQDFHLLLIGDGPELPHIQSLVRQLDIESSVTFGGRRNDVPALLRMADGYVFPSYTEGLPNSLLEAMAAGLPIVATDVPGNKDLIRSTENGLLVPSHNPQELAGAISRILSDSDFARKLGQAAASDTDYLFHIDQTWESYAQLYEATQTTPPSQS